ncbi:unnamed protein product [Sphagnum balticum]
MRTPRSFPFLITDSDRFGSFIVRFIRNFTAQAHFRNSSLQKTKDLRLVQVALGHRNITNTMVYADYIYSQQELRKLIL